ncbi:imidazole glycerol phosphate synthase HisHF [Ascobolus immersus RN42]|uniref:Imidazole glycerol phosphate synthase hisHF n=1 Tax=Ascobolus immersus RN42 TaxID=1160509 RepID=A0A3N4IJQ2_ASCIM|nr:imidazole glycerol phosphate synthase HisHF [Ascobolus immersus RN42]
MTRVHVIGNIAGNIRSLVNALEAVGVEVAWITTPEDISSAKIVILPGVGNFGHCVRELATSGLLTPLRKYIEKGNPFLGICVGMQVLFDGSEEDASIAGLGILSGSLKRFDDRSKSVPHIGWSTVMSNSSDVSASLGQFYFVHSFKLSLPWNKSNDTNGWEVLKASYYEEDFVAGVHRGAVLATQYHPEKSGVLGLKFLREFLINATLLSLSLAEQRTITTMKKPTCRVIACLDVREDDNGTLVVTKGDSYDVRSHTSDGNVRNVGDPVRMAQAYYESGADEIVFLNITSFRRPPAENSPTLELLEKVSRSVFVPLTIGGGIVDFPLPDGSIESAFNVARRYFSAGADKVSIGSDAVYAAEKYWRNGAKPDGTSSIEAIAKAYGNQAVVVSIDPRKQYVKASVATEHTTFPASPYGPEGEECYWYQCTTKGGREGSDLDVVQLARAVQHLGAGEILVNSIDNDGKNMGFDLQLLSLIKRSVQIPVIASSGAGKPQHFVDAFEQTTVDAALGAGMFHRGDFTVQDVKSSMHNAGLPVRQTVAL